MEHKEAEEIHMVIGEPPKWLSRYGAVILLAIFSLIIIFSAFIKFPDEIRARVILVTENPPIHVFSRATGRVNELKVRDKEVITSGQILAVIESNASYKDIIYIEEMVDRLSDKRASEFEEPKNLQLGELQQYYTLILTKVSALNSFKKFNTYESQISLLSVQSEMIKELTESLESQFEILNEEFLLSESEMKRNDILRKNNSLSMADYEKARSTFLQQKRNLEIFNANLINNRLKEQEVKTQIVSLRKALDDDLQKRHLDLSENLREFKAMLVAWKQTNLLIAPISGVISLRNIRAQNEFIKINDEFAVIDPVQNSGAYIGRAVVQGSRVGKLKIGMKAIIHLDNYPHHEYGSIIGSVSEISNIPQEAGYAVKIQLAKEKSTYNLNIPLSQEMGGDLRIITENMSIAKRSWNQIMSITKNRP